VRGRMRVARGARSASCSRRFASKRSMVTRKGSRASRSLGR
jgi:hypothetical protein